MEVIEAEDDPFMAAASSNNSHRLMTVSSTQLEPRLSGEICIPVFRITAPTVDAGQIYQEGRLVSMTNKH